MQRFDRSSLFTKVVMIVSYAANEQRKIALLLGFESGPPDIYPGICSPDE
jgi:hypothetical protein